MLIREKEMTATHGMRENDGHLPSLNLAPDNPQLPPEKISPYATDQARTEKRFPKT